MTSTTPALRFGFSLSEGTAELSSSPQPVGIRKYPAQRGSPPPPRVGVLPIESESVCEEIHRNNTHMKKNIKIVVIGGSGLIGTKLVYNLRQRGHEVVAASPSSGVNTLTGEGLFAPACHKDAANACVSQAAGILTKRALAAGGGLEDAKGGIHTSPGQRPGFIGLKPHKC